MVFAGLPSEAQAAPSSSWLIELFSTSMLHRLLGLLVTYAVWFRLGLFHNTDSIILKEK